MSTLSVQQTITTRLEELQRRIQTLNTQLTALAHRYKGAKEVPAAVQKQVHGLRDLRSVLQREADALVQQRAHMEQKAATIEGLAVQASVIEARRELTKAHSDTNKAIDLREVGALRELDEEQSRDAQDLMEELTGGAPAATSVSSAVLAEKQQKVTATDLFAEFLDGDGDEHEEASEADQLLPPAPLVVPAPRRETTARAANPFLASFR